MRLRAAVLGLALLAACAPQAPPSLRPILPTAHQLVIPITPGCDYGVFSTWTFVPPLGQTPAVAWYDAVSSTGGHPALQGVAGQSVTVTLPSGVGPWQLFLLTPDTTWAPVSNVVVNPPPRCQ